MGTNPIVPSTSPPERPFGPPWRVALAIGLTLTIGALLALWPVLRALSIALSSAVETHGGLIAGTLFLFVACLLIALLRIVYAVGWKMDASARQARVVRMQNDLPISVDDVHAVFERHATRSLDQHYATKLAEAERPTPLLTSQNLHIRQVGMPAPLALPEGVGAPLAIPTFAQLLDQGLIGPGRPLILGYNADSGQAIMGAWKDLYSCGVGAQQGAGKTWLLAFLLAQSAAGGGRLIICDLHAGDDESLANRIGALAPAFMCDIASTPKEIESAFAFADDKLEKRRTGGPARWPIVLCCDEWTSLLRTSAGSALPAHIQNIAEQGRKFNVNGILAAQAWTKAASSDVRNQLTSHYVMRQRPDEARYQLGLRGDQLPADIRGLPDATGYLLNVRGELIKIVVPHMTAADIARCGELIDRQAGSPAKFGFTAPTARLTGAVAGTKPESSQTVAGTVAATTAARSAKRASPEAARAAGLFVAGKSPSEIVTELRGVKSSEGSRYQIALNEILELIREGVQS